MQLRRRAEHSDGNPARTDDDDSQPAATIMDHQPLVNIQPFGMCITPTDPAVAAAPWVPGAPNVLLGGMPTGITHVSSCACGMA